jgi:monoterpene epsilon-lactone hydrolase
VATEVRQLVVNSSAVPVMSAEDDVELTNLLTALEADNWPDDIQEARRFYDEWGTPVAADVRVDERTVGGVPAFVLTPPESDESRIGLYLHGGGYVYGSQLSHGSLAGEAARAARCPMVHLQYRRAPEHPYPAALDDAVSAYAALLEERSPNQLVMLGDSAGGGLVFATLMAARDRGLPMPGAAACISPWVDLAGTGETFRTLREVDPMITAQTVTLVTDSYLAGTAPTTPYASPLYGDVRGFPPVLIQVGAREMLLSDAERFAAKLAEAGSPVALEVWPGMVHVWHLHHTRLAKARQALARLGSFLQSPVRQLAAAEPDGTEG